MRGMERGNRLLARSRRTDPVHRITDAGQAPSEELSGRQTRYLISMGVRTLCFLLAVIASGWLRWVLLSGAILLPYISVVIANAGRERVENFPSSLFAPRRKSLGGSESGDKTGQ